jgi:positive regulator of sigma E activity
MGQLWTIIFVALLAVGFSLAAWHDRDKAKRQEQRNIAYRNSDKTDD